MVIRAHPHIRTDLYLPAAWQALRVILTCIIHERLGVALRNVTACGHLREQRAAAVPGPKCTHPARAGCPTSPVQHRVLAADRSAALALGTSPVFGGAFMNHPRHASRWEHPGWRAEQWAWL